MAQDEGWMSKAGSKWKTMPQLMLQYRAAMFFTRAYCPEALLGMHTREELYDMDMQETTPGTFEPQEPVDSLEKRILNGDSDHDSEAPAEDKKAWWDRDNWVKIRKAGFKDWLAPFMHRAHEVPSEIWDEIDAKYKRLYPGQPFPGNETIGAEAVYDPSDDIKQEAADSLIETNGNGNSNVDNERATIISTNVGLEGKSKTAWADAYFHEFSQHIDFFTGYETMTAGEISRWNESILKALDFEESNGR
jgi:hypothetical protein